MGTQQKIAIISLGDELLKGFTINTNSAFIGQELLAMGALVSFNVTIRDDENDIFNTLKYACDNADIIITTGGLGPTQDDITTKVIADFFNLTLYKNTLAEENIKKYFKITGRTPSKSAMQQAFIPQGSKAFKNKVGLAPGIWLDVIYKNKNKSIIMLPGPPREMQAVFSEITPNLKLLFEDNKVYTKIFYIGGLPESIIEKRTLECLETDKNLRLAYCANIGRVKLFLTHKNNNTLNKYIEIIKNEFQDNILQEGTQSLVQDLIYLLKANNAQIATAESCTGGMIAENITDNPGTSSIFPGGLIVYSNKEKIKLLNISKKTLDKYGAVSKETATEMITNLLANFAVNTGIAVTGIAGPTGGTPEKPIGLVFIAIAFNDKKIVEKYNFTGDRNTIRIKTMQTAFNNLRNLIRS